MIIYVEEERSSFCDVYLVDGNERSNLKVRMVLGPEAIYE